MTKTQEQLPASMTVAFLTHTKATLPEHLHRMNPTGEVEKTHTWAAAGKPCDWVFQSSFESLYVFFDTGYGYMAVMRWEEGELKECAYTKGYIVRMGPYHVEWENDDAISIKYMKIVAYESKRPLLLKDSQIKFKKRCGLE